MKNILTNTYSRLGALIAFTAIALFVSAHGHRAQARDDKKSYRIIDLKTDTLPSLNMARTGHVTLCLDGELTVLGGHTDGFIPTATAEYFRDGEWHTVPLVYPHDHAAVIELRSGKVFLAGGHKEPLGISQLFSVEFYDPLTHTSQGFGCMEKKRAFANAIEMADGQVIISGNWFADDCIEMFGNVEDPFKPNAVKVKDVSVPRAKPYILRVSDDDAIIFSSLGNTNEEIESGIVDRLNGSSYLEPFLNTWKPIRTVVIQRSVNQFIGNEGEERYEWLLPVENDETREVAIARVKGGGTDGSVAAFSLLPTEQPLPDSIYGKPITYSSLVCDRNRETAYLIGNNEEFRVIVVAIPYGTSAPAKLTVYVTEPQPFKAESSTPVLTADGDLVFAGGHLINNFSPTNSVVRLPLGQADSGEDSAASSESGARVWWLWIVIPCLLALIILAVIIARRKRTRTDVPQAWSAESAETGESEAFDNNMSKEETLADLFKRIERLMEEKQLYLNPNLRASDVAASVGSNTAYVSAAINSQRGCSFSQFLTTYRISHAQELMRKNPDSKISTISTLSGFSTDSTFFRAFRAITGMTPKEWLSATGEERQP